MKLLLGKHRGFDLWQDTMKRRGQFSARKPHTRVTLTADSLAGVKRRIDRLLARIKRK